METVNGASPRADASAAGVRDNEDSLCAASQTERSSEIDLLLVGRCLLFVGGSDDQVVPLGGKADCLALGHDFFRSLANSVGDRNLSEGQRQVKVHCLFVGSEINVRCPRFIP